MNLLALLPFGYATVTRHNTLRDFAYLVATQWLPGIWLIFRLGDGGLGSSIVLYMIGYLAFISIYEIGYLANDTWDADKNPDSRRRFSCDVTLLYIIIFISLRLALWSFITIYYPSSFGLMNWLMLYGALVVVFSVHNIVNLNYLRMGTFLQLCAIRFLAPVIYGLQSNNFLIIMIVCWLFYINFRYIVYLESKGFLIMPQRKYPLFNFSQIIILCPFVILLSVVTSEGVILEIFMYFMVLYGGYAVSLR